MIDDYYQGVISRYRKHLPIEADDRIITLNEGNTPLIALDNIARDLNFSGKIYAKFEGLNPTGSFKDRGMTVAVTKAVNEGCEAIICASTGNTSAAAAAYGTRAGMKVFVVIPEGKIAMGKLAQAQVYGSVVIQIKGNFDQGLAMVKAVAEKYPITIVNSVNPYRLQGQKTASFEIVDALGRAPDYHCLPVGNAGNITSYWLGYNEYYTAGVIKQKPKMLGFQAEGSAPFIHDMVVENPETKATAIRIGNPQYFAKAKQAAVESAGRFASLTDAEIISTQYYLASTEGVFCEPASAAAVAGVIRDIKENKIEDGSTIVCTLTGNGLKDPDLVQAMDIQAPFQVEPELAAIEKIIGM